MSRRTWVGRACGLSVILWSSLAAAAGGNQHYIIDQPREKQQANFCTSRQSIEEIAGIFDRLGPRPGYTALSASPDCFIAVHTFTPRRVLAVVTISEGKPGEYMVRFVEVENAFGDTMYLVTTRGVVKE